MEENKVATDNEVLTGQDKPSARDRLAKVSSMARYNGHVKTYISDDDYRIADAILQSPDLRVTLVEPRYYVDDGNPGYIVVDRKTTLILAEFVNGGARQQRASEYCAWLNSKEPK